MQIEAEGEATMNMRNRYASRWTLVCLVAALGATRLYAELIAYDQFAGYTEGNLNGQNGGVGWNAWNIGTNDDDETIVTNNGNLAYSVLPTKGGGALVVNANESSDNSFLIRDLATPLTVSGTYYFGFVIQQSGNPYKASFRIQDSTGQRFAGGGAWDGQNEWQLYRRNGGSFGRVDTGINDTTDVTYFVLKLVFSTSGDETAYLYVNPENAGDLADGSQDATYAFGGSGQWTDISRIQGSLVGDSGDVGTMAFDEIRIGTEPEDMFDHIGVEVVLSNESVDKNLAAGTLVGSLSVANTNGAFTFSLTESGSFPDNASFILSGPGNSNLLTDAVFDYEAQTNYSIRVLATETAPGTLLRTNTFSIAVNNEVESWGGVYALATVAPAETDVATLASVPGENTNVTYSVLAGFDAAKFEITGPEQDVLALTSSSFAVLGEEYFVNVQALGTPDNDTSSMLVKVTVASTAPPNATLFFIK